MRPRELPASDSIEIVSLDSARLISHSEAGPAAAFQEGMARLFPSGPPYVNLTGNAQTADVLVPGPMPAPTASDIAA